MKHFAMLNEKCDCCGRFVAAGGPGVSWSQNWSYCMDGSPDLHDPRYRCSPCTDKFGIGNSNCAPPEFYRGRFPARARIAQGG